MYGNEPDLWDDALRGKDRLRFIVNALTRLRIVDADGRMRLKFKDGAASAPKGTVPWFDHPNRATRDTPIVFGHWSTEGLVRRSNVTGIDTGCVWGGKLTALAARRRRAVPGRLPAVAGTGRRLAALPLLRRLRALGPSTSPKCADNAAWAARAIVWRLSYAAASSGGRNATSISRSLGDQHLWRAK